MIYRHQILKNMPLQALYPAVLSLFLLPAHGCGGAQTPEAERSYGDNARDAYEAALEDFEDEDCIAAEPAFREVRRTYPYSRYAALAELRVADCLMIEKKYPEAISAYGRFVRFRPSHAQVPYARFKVAEGYYQQIPDDFFLSPPSYELDQAETEEAMIQLRRFLLDYPEHEKVDEAREFLTKALDSLARHELYVAEYYLNRDHPEAAVIRLNTLLEAYQESSLVPEALLLLGQVRIDRDEVDEARVVFEKVREDFPDSRFSAQAEEYLAGLPTASSDLVDDGS